ncbi:MAG: NIPSNAP family protein [Dehalococcoidia bacterium]|nr:NIPSNAP family protein [Dehalococcoidia bacterium]
MPVIVEAIHVIKPITNTIFDRWVEWYGNEIIPAMERNGFDVLGAFKKSTGPMGEDMLLMRFENMAAYEAAGLSLRNDAKFVAAVSARKEWTISERAKTANIVPYATEQRLERMLAKPEKPRQYMQATLQVSLGGQPKAYELIGKLADLIDGSGRMALATAYETAIGQRGELTDIWAYFDGMPDLSYRPGDPIAELTAELRKVAPEESITYLNPLPYSKLQ